MSNLGVILYLISFTVSSFLFLSQGLGQDTDELKQRIAASLQKVEDYPVVIAKGTTISLNGFKQEVIVHFRAGKMYMEDDAIAAAEGIDERRLRSVYEAMGTSNLKVTSQFDGKRCFSFSPYNLTLMVRTANERPQAIEGTGLLPSYWVRMGTSSTQYFRKILEEKKDYETKVEKLADGRWKLSQSNLGSLLPEGNAKVTIRDRFIIVDENCDFLVTEYFGEGAIGRLSGTIEWAKKDGNWYAKHGKQMAGLKGDKTYREWFIHDISFDATKCRNRFDDLESIVPFGTKIILQDEKQNEISTSYKGGKEGEAEFKLRDLAKLKRTKEGF